jgi:hypothetical protein
MPKLLNKYLDELTFPEQEISSDNYFGDQMEGVRRAGRSMHGRGEKCIQRFRRKN